MPLISSIRAKRILRFGLPALGLVAILWPTLRDRPAQTAVSAAPQASPASSPKVIAYYFHTTFRCPTCRRIESLSREALEQGFADALKDGRLQWQVVNVEDNANRHFIRDFRLFTKSLVLVRIKDGKQAEWKNLHRVWELVRRQEAFLRYVQDEVRAFLEAS